MEKLELLKERMTKELEDTVICAISPLIYEELKKLGYEPVGDVTPEEAYKLECLCDQIIEHIIEIAINDEDDEY